MKTVRAYIGIGSNLQQPANQIQRGLAALQAMPDTRLLRRSPWYGSKAIGPGKQPDYINGVIELETFLSVKALLQHLQHIEQAQGRERKEHWGPRTLDLDILLYGNQLLETVALQIPHPRLTQRAFVLKPLADLDRALCLPDPNGTKNATIGALLQQLPADQLEAVWLLEGEQDAVLL